MKKIKQFKRTPGTPMYLPQDDIGRALKLLDKDHDLVEKKLNEIIDKLNES